MRDKGNVVGEREVNGEDDKGGRVREKEQEECLLSTG